MMGQFRGKLYVEIQWNPSTPDTIGTTVSVLISEVSLFQGLICTHLYVFVAKPLEVSGFEGCPDFRGVRSEGFHCISSDNSP